MQKHDQSLAWVPVVSVFLMMIGAIIGYGTARLDCKPISTKAEPIVVFMETRAPRLDDLFTMDCASEAFRATDYGTYECLPKWKEKK